MGVKLSDIQLIFDFENIKGEIQELAGGNSREAISAYLEKITKDRKVVYTEDIISELRKSGGAGSKRRPDRDSVFIKTQTKSGMSRTNIRFKLPLRQ